MAMFGLARSAIAPGSLRGRIALVEGRVGEALALSWQSVAQLEARRGPVPKPSEPPLTEFQR
jgi:hypothetical protein